MSKLFICLCFLAAIFENTFLSAQTIKQIRQSDKYIYGIGQSDLYEKADQFALSDLISQISVRVEDSLTLLRTEENGNYKEQARSIINTYSSATLTNALRIEEKDNGIYTVIRYLPKEELYKIFEKRKKAILEYTKEGMRAEWTLQIGDALRNYYWAYILLRSHPDFNSMTFCNENDTVLLNVFLPNRINEIFSNINIEVLEEAYKPEEKYMKYTLGLKYKNENIQNLDYCFKYKNSWSSTIGANNGIACIEYYGDDAEKYRDISIRIEYMYRNKAFFDKDVQSVLSSELDLPYFNKCEIKTQSNENNVVKNVNTGLAIKQLNDINDKTTLTITNNLQKIISYIEQKNLSVDPNIFTTEGLDAYNKLIKYGDAVVLKQKNELKIININNEYIVRSIPMKFTFSRDHLFVEDVVFIFNEEGKISDINFSLSQIAIKDILSKDERFATQEEKYFIIRFIENYKTAYCLKRIDYIQKIFDEDALIIIGNVLKKQNLPDNPYYSSLPDNEITYQRYTKSEYMERLSKVFSYNEFVNIHFEDNVVKKAKRDISIYGIQIAQHYTSQTYADKGYLFLLVDLRDTANPVIHVRTWQPQKNEDGSIYGLEDFPFEKL